MATSPLFSPLPIRTMTLPNRIVLPAMVTRLSGEDGVVNDDIRARYVRYAKGGAGSSSSRPWRCTSPRAGRSCASAATSSSRA